MTADLGSSGEINMFDKGKHIIPYVILIPNDFTWREKEKCPLPPTFLNKDVPQNIAYALEVSLTKKEMFATNEL